MRYRFYKLSAGLLEMAKHVGTAKAIQYTGKEELFDLPTAGIVGVPILTKARIMKNRELQYIPVPGMEVMKNEPKRKGKKPV